MPPKGNPEASVVIVGEAPGAWEKKRGEPFIGPSGQKLNDMLYFAGIKRSETFLSNAILCQPDVPGEQGRRRYDMKLYHAWIRLENTKRKKSEKITGIPFEPISSPLDCCAPRLWRELAWFEELATKRGQPNGAVVIALGNYALKAITGREGILKMRGSPLIVSLDDPYKPQEEIIRERNESP